MFAILYWITGWLEQLVTDVASGYQQSATECVLSSLFVRDICWANFYLLPKSSFYDIYFYILRV